MCEVQPAGGSIAVGLSARPRTLTAVPTRCAPCMSYTPGATGRSILRSLGAAAWRTRCRHLSHLCHLRGPWKGGCLQVCDLTWVAEGRSGLTGAASWGRGL